MYSFLQSVHLRSRLGRTLHKMASVDPAHSNSISFVLSNEQAMRMLEEKVRELAEQHQVEIAWMEKCEDDPAPSPVHPVLAWLWAHREEILQFVLAIVALLSAGTWTVVP